MASCGLSKYFGTKLQTTCFHLILSFCKKKKKKNWNWSPCLIFCKTFEEKYFCDILLIDQISLYGYLYEILGNMCITIVCKPGSEVMNFDLIFLIKPFFLHDEKVVTKT